MLNSVQRCLIWYEFQLMGEEIDSSVYDESQETW